jgi:hypothetical protein
MTPDAKAKRIQIQKFFKELKGRGVGNAAKKTDN